MSTRLIPAPRLIVLVARENLAGFAALAVLAGGLYGLYAFAGDGIGDWMDAGATLVAALVPLVVVGSFAEKTAGEDALWLQKPVDPLRLHLARFFHILFVAVVATVLFRCVATAIGLAVGWDPEGRALQPVVVEATTAFAVVAVGFGMSCWWGDRGRWTTAAYLAFSVVALLQIDFLRAEADGGPLAQVVRAALFPFGARREIVEFLSGRSDAVWQPFGWLLAYVVAWLAVGLAGICLREENRTK